MTAVIYSAATPGHGKMVLARSEPDTVPNDLGDWRPEQLWLSGHCRSQVARQRMADAVATATDAVVRAADAVVPQHELLMVFRYTRRDAAALRLKARILRGARGHATPAGRDLAASALWLAAIQHDDLLAATEFAAEVTGRAASLEAVSEEGNPPLPPGMSTVGQLASRMRCRGREVLAHRPSWLELDTIGGCLERAQAEDPLRTPSGIFEWENS